MHGPVTQRPGRGTTNADARLGGQLNVILQARSVLPGIASDTEGARSCSMQASILASSCASKRTGGTEWTSFRELHELQLEARSIDGEVALRYGQETRSFHFSVGSPMGPGLGVEFGSCPNVCRRAMYVLVIRPAQGDSDDHPTAVPAIHEATANFEGTSPKTGSYPEQNINGATQVTDPR